jgi:hypothetical protein
VRTDPRRTAAGLAAAIAGLALVAACGQGSQDLAGQVKFDVIMDDAAALTNPDATPPNCSAPVFNGAKVQILDGAGKVLKVVEPSPAEAKFDKTWVCVRKYEASVPPVDVYKVVLTDAGCHIGAPKVVNRSDLENGRLPDLSSLGSLGAVSDALTGTTC